MESQSQNPEFRNNPENFHPCICRMIYLEHIPQKLACLLFFPILIFQEWSLSVEHDLDYTVFLVGSC